VVSIKPVHQILLLLGLVLFIGFVFFQVGLSVSPNTAIGVAVFMGIIAALMFFFYRYQKRGSRMEMAMEYAKQFWARKFDGESLGRLENRGTEGYCGQQAYYTFIFQRIGGKRAGEFAKIIVKPVAGNSFDIAHHNELPSVDEKQSPFEPLDQEVLFTPAPTPDVQYRYYKTFGGPRGANAPVASVNVSTGTRSEEIDKK